MSIMNAKEARTMAEQRIYPKIEESIRWAAQSGKMMCSIYDLDKKTAKEVKKRMISLGYKAKISSFCAPEYKVIIQW